MQRFRIIIFSFLLLTFGCSNGDENPIKETRVSFFEIGKGKLYGNGQENISQSNNIITNQIDWENLMIQMNSVSNITDNFKETTINFKKFIVIAVFLEVKGNAYEVEIDNVVETENSIKVSLTETPYLLSVVTQPFHIVKILKTDKPILFD